VRDALSKKYITYLTETVEVSSNASFTMIMSASESLRVRDELSYVRGRFLSASETLSVSDAITKTLITTLTEGLRVDSSASISTKRGR
jgi:uncharacterized protein YxjI